MRDWTKAEEAKRLRERGLTFRAVGEVLGCSANHARQLVLKIERRDRELAIGRPNYLARPPWWSGLSTRTVWELENAGFFSREDCMILAEDEMTSYSGWMNPPGWKNSPWQRRMLSLKCVIEVRKWLGVSPHPLEEIILRRQLKAARKLLEKHGWRVEPPSDARGWLGDKEKS